MSFFSRYRHGRGFGIHSPFAFRFITECLNERLPYYDYASIADKADRTLYRVACRLQPGRIAAVGGADASPALLACPRAEKSDAPEADMIVVSGASTMDKGVFSDALAREAVIYIRGRHRRLLGELIGMMDSLGCGMTFCNCADAAVIVPRRKLPRQDFDVRF